MYPVSALILAGGKGTRLASLYPNLPKPLVPVAGQPFLYWLVLWLTQQGVDDFVLSLGYQAEKIAAWANETPLLESVSHELFEEPMPLGTGGGVLSSLHLCKHDIILVSNGDSLCLSPLEEMISDFVAAPNYDAVIVGKAAADTSRYATLVVDENSNLIDYREKVSGSGIISAGVYLFRKSILADFPTGQPFSMEYDIIPKLLSSGHRILVHQVGLAPFIDIGTPETAGQATKFIYENFAQDVNTLITPVSSGNT